VFKKARARLDLETLESRLAPSAVVNVNAAANVHAINPDIYGTAFATTAQLADLNSTVNRDGGNSSDTYNWQADATNHASDWYYESIASGSGNGQSMDAFVSQSDAGGAQPDLTVPILPEVASLGPGGADLGSYPVSVYGPQQSTDPYNSNFGNGVTPSGQDILDTNPLYNYVANTPSYEQTWIQHLLSTFGTPGNGGVPFFTLGNEPGLWSSTHRDIHPNGETNTELLNDIIAYGSMIKSLDPTAQILGPEEWGWTNYFIDGADAAAQNWSATYGGLNVQQWLLQQLNDYQQQTGTRLLDYFTLHYYPQESVNGDNGGGIFSNNVDQATELLRNQVTRALWDPNYVDPSWIGGTGVNGGIIDLIPMMQSWVNTYYPGTKIGVTEYNFGAEGNMNGATAQADVYGIFGQQGLDLATRWTTPATGSPTYLAMKLWRNYDGNDSGFGNVSVGASVGNPDDTDAFAALRSSDGALTVAVINKNLYDPSNPSATTPVTINLSGFVNNGVAQEWQLAAVNPSDQTNAAITHLADVQFNGTSFTINVPMESVTMFVIKPGTAPVATTSPPSETVTAGQTVILTAAATGNPTPAVQWQLSTNGGSFTKIAGATATTYTFKATTGESGNEYRAVFSSPAGSATTTVATLTVLWPSLQIDAGGSAASPYRADVDHSGGNTFSTTHAIDTTGVANAAPQAVYQSMRTGNFTYSVGGLQKNASYAVRLQFAEDAINAAGLRVFNVAINGTQVLTNFDVFAAAGAEYKAILRQFTAAANKSGVISIKFTTVVGSARVSGIQVLPIATVVQAINAGGPAAGSYAADTDFSGGTTSSTSTTIDTSGVSNPAPQAVYQSERQGTFTYLLGGLLPGATYSVRLDFAEIDFTSAGQRVFNVQINGTPVLTQFDIIAAAGAPNKAIAESFTATADKNGNIGIDFTGVVGEATVGGIAISLQ
jgi:hypothetical protein